MVFHDELQMYADEGLSTESIRFEDNLECVALIEARPTGLLALLDAECRMGDKVRGEKSTHTHTRAFMSELF